MNPLWDSVFLWRTLALVLLSVVVGLVVFRKRIITMMSKEEMLEHDRNIFTNAASLLAERHLINFFDTLLSDHSYTLSDVRPIDKLILFYEEIQNRYLNNKLNKATDNLVLAIDKVRSFVSLNFFVYPEGQTGENLRLCMYPEFNIDRGGATSKEKMRKYDEWRDQLEDIVKDARTKYDIYRQTVKKKLFI